MYQSLSSAPTPATMLHVDLASYASSLLEAGHAEHTARAYVSRVQIFREYCISANASNSPKETLRSFTTYLQEGLGYRPNSVRASVTAVRDYLKRCGIEAVIYSVPSGSGSEGPVRLTEEQEHRMWCAIRSARSPKFRALAALILSTGIRVGELRNARISWLKFGAEGASIEISGRHGRRTVGLSEEATFILLEWLATAAGLWPADEYDPLIFANHQGCRLSYTAINNICKSVSRQANLDVCGRTLRNTFVQRTLEAR
jgi:integrase